jgi:NitT/TauT family transport system substrate-binding protein
MGVLAMHKPVSAAVAAMMTAVWLLAESAAAQTPEKFTFALNWFAVGDHAAYWVALEKGYFTARGLDVTLENSKGSGDSIAKVDTGRADAGLADTAVVIAALARNAKIKIVGMVFDKTPLNVFSSTEKAIRKPKDLEGKTIAAPPGDSQRQIWPAFAKANQVDDSKVTWVNVEPAAKIAALAEKRVDAVADYTTGLPYYEKPMGAGNVVMMPWANFGLDMYSMSIMASEKTMTEKPKALRAFLQAAYMGWRDVMADPKEAITIFKKRVPEIDAAIIEANMHLGLDLMKTPRFAANGIGWMEQQKMCSSVDLVNTYMDLPRKVTCSAVFTNEFLSKVAIPQEAK